MLFFPRGEHDDDDSKAFFFAPASQLRYAVEDGVPILLVEEADDVGQEEHARLLATAERLGIK